MARNNKRNAEHWHRLDNTANLFPVVTSKKFSNVFRLSLTLTENINEKLLQQALEHILPRFPAFNVRLRHGLFWHYLETNCETPVVRREDDYPCRYIEPHQNNYFLFKVTYYEKRINLETFHVLTDGTGSLQFLLALSCRYLILACPDVFSDEQKAQNWFTEHAKDTEDSYVANYTPTKKSGFREGAAFKLKGERNVIGGLSVIHAYIPTDEIISLCHEKNVSVTQYISACAIWGIYKSQLASKPNKKPVNIFLPVNLRNIFNSKTALNFFSNIYVSLLFNDENITFDDVILSIKAQFEEKINKEKIQEKISFTVGSGYSNFVRVVPLPIKKAMLRIIYEASNKSCTLGYSNLGIVKLPEPFSQFIVNSTFLVSTAPREPMKIGSISCGGNLTVSFTSTLKSVAVQREIIRKFSSDGLNVCVESNGVDYESM